MSTPVATVSDLAIYLGLGDSVDDDKATLILQLAHDLCESIISPVPLTALGVELDVAGRAYLNPTNETTTAPGPYGSTSSASIGGLWLTKANIAALRRLSPSTSGAFTIDPTPADAGAGNYWPQLPTDPSDSWSSYPYGDWDQILT